jgi:hypothetical protein
MHRFLAGKDRFIHRTNAMPNPIEKAAAIPYA